MRRNMTNIVQILKIPYQVIRSYLQSLDIALLHSDRFNLLEVERIPTKRSF